MANYNIIKKTKGDIVFDVVNTIFMLALVFITLYPMYYVLCTVCLIQQ